MASVSVRFGANEVEDRANHFFGSWSILRAAKTENLVPRCPAPRFFFAPKPHASYAGYIVNNAVCLLDVRVIRATEGIFI